MLLICIAQVCHSEWGDALGVLGQDAYRADHPAMQFVALQLRLMNQGMTKAAAFKQVRLDTPEYVVWWT